MFETVPQTKTIPSHIRPKIDLQVPHGEKKVLIHSCCAPCAGELMELMMENGIELTIYFYNPNIHPKKEYDIRKEENIRFAEKLGIPFIDADYNVQDWFHNAKGMEKEPERGVRCTMCFDMRFVKTAEYAKNNGFKIITSSLGISRWKNMEQINDCGHKAAGLFEGITYWDYNWRQKGGGARMYEIAKREQFYQQEYCGCIYSLRDSNEWREKNGREKIKIGEQFYAEKIDEVVS
jgi:predicted adenine nucleotide alpha hydrolase (AANH) superfamily ATPase